MMGVNFSNIAYGSASLPLCFALGPAVSLPVLTRTLTPGFWERELLQHLGEHAAIKLIELSMSLARQLLAFACLEASL